MPDGSNMTVAQSNLLLIFDKSASVSACDNYFLFDRLSELGETLWSIVDQKMGVPLNFTFGGLQPLLRSTGHACQSTTAGTIFEASGWYRRIDK